MVLVSNPAEQFSEGFAGPKTSLAPPPEPGEFVLVTLTASSEGRTSPPRSDSLMLPVEN
jgi:hypothetical protein